MYVVVRGDGGVVGVCGDDDGVHVVIGVCDCWCYGIIKCGVDVGVTCVAGFGVYCVVVVVGIAHSGGVVSIDVVVTIVADVVGVVNIEVVYIGDGMLWGGVVVLGFGIVIGVRMYNCDVVIRVDIDVDDHGVAVIVAFVVGICCVAAVVAAVTAVMVEVDVGIHVANEEGCVVIGVVMVMVCVCIW